MHSVARYEYFWGSGDWPPQAYDQYHVIVNGGVEESTSWNTNPWSNSLYSNVVPSPPNCYNARITITVHSGLLACCTTAEHFHEEAGVQCLQGPPPPIEPEDPKDEPIEYVPLETGLGDPLVLDLNGDGIQTTSLEWPVQFDMLGDGTRTTMAWSDPQTEEGFLWLDLFPNQRVDDGRELFGTGTILPSGARATDGFEALRVYDSAPYGGNADGKIDREDTVWRRLRLWVDRDHDATSDHDEVRPIQESGVLTILLPASSSMNVLRDVNGNLHVVRTHYSFRDGNTARWREIHNLEFLMPMP
jgi:hypothetical protein